MAKKFLSLKVLERFMSPEEVSAFMEKYNANLQTDRTVRAASEQDKAMLADYQAGGKVTVIAKKYGVGPSVVSSSVLRAIKG